MQLGKTSNIAFYLHSSSLLPDEFKLAEIKRRRYILCDEELEKAPRETDIDRARGSR